MTGSDTQKGQAQKKESPRGAYLFLLVVGVAYLILSFVAPDRTVTALGFSLGMLTKLLPVLMVVCVLMFITNMLVKPRWVRNHVGHDSGIKGLLISIVGGILSMGPIYVWYEILRDLQRKGMRSSLIASFLYARSVKPQLLPLMIHYFGWIYSMLLVVYLIIFSIVNGWLTERLIKR